MAQLRDSKIDGNLEITGDIILKTNRKSICGVHPETGDTVDMLSISANGNTLVGCDGYYNENGDTYIYGKDIRNYISSADSNYRPYYRAGDSIDFAVRTTGYLTGDGKTLVFTIPTTMPIIGAPTATVTRNSGFILRQDNKYTHGSNGGSNTVYAVPTSYAIAANYNSGFVISAYFDNATNAINNSPIGVFCNCTITLT
jgi:hypothetical protein